MTSDPSGFVYLVVHPKFPGWVKVGSTTNPERRLASYNTGDPMRSYRMLSAEPASDRRHAEWLAHTRLRKLGYDKRGEWFDVGIPVAINTIRRAVAETEEHPLLA